MSGRITRNLGSPWVPSPRPPDSPAALPAQAATVFLDDFSDGMADGWTTTNGSWAVAAEDGNLAFQQTDGSADARAIATNVGSGTSGMNILTARVKPRSTGGSVAVLFNALDANNYAFAALRAGRVESAAARTARSPCSRRPPTHRRRAVGRRSASPAAPAPRRR